MADKASVSAARDQYTFRWTKEQTDEFIKLRGENDVLFTGAKNSASVGWRLVLEKMGLSGIVSPAQAKKKWDNLKKKYKECKYPGSEDGVSGKPTTSTWPWFVPMNEILEQKPSICPVVLISSIPEDNTVPSAAVSDQEEREDTEKDGDRQPARKRRKDTDQALLDLIREDMMRRRDTDQELIDLIREDMRQQREAEERRAQETRERMNRLFSILDRLVPK